MSQPHHGSARPRPPSGAGVTRFATRGDHRLSYESIGEAEGTPLLALHDLLIDRGQMRPLAETLAPFGFRLTLPDARGHGASPMIGGMAYPVRELAADMFAVLDAEGIAATRVIAAGWSAAIALELAALAPERVHSLALIAPNLPALLRDVPVPEARRYGEALLETMGEAADAAARGQTDRALDLYLGVRWGSTWRDRLMKPRLGAIRRAAVNLAPLLNEMASDRVDRERLRDVTRPIMLLLRHDAPAFERWNAEALAALNPRAALRTVTIATEEEGHAALAPDWAPALALLLGEGLADS